MAEEKKPGGLMAILGVGKKSDDEEDGDEAKSPKARALKAMFDAADAGDWDEAAKEFGRAYDICKMKGEEGEESDYAESDDEE